MLNEYWYVSWWTQFDFYDKKAHEIAKQILWPCVTSNAEVKFTRPCYWIDEYETMLVNSTKSSVIIMVSAPEFYWVFTFIKLK